MVHGTMHGTTHDATRGAMHEATHRAMRTTHVGQARAPCMAHLAAKEVGLETEAVAAAAAGRLVVGHRRREVGGGADVRAGHDGAHEEGQAAAEQ